MKPLPSNDFRARRLMLTDDDFAFSSGEYLGPTNLIDEATWNSIVSLPDDVSIRTSDRFGPQLRQVWRFWDLWNRVVGAVQSLSNSSAESATAIAACDASDEFQAGVYCSLVGHYRVAFSCLRNVLEQITIAAQLDIKADKRDFHDWRNADERIKFGWAADMLPKNARLESLEEHLRVAVNDTLFDQNPKGFARRLFAELSKYAHGAAEFTDGDLRQSNGPIFVAEAFLGWCAVMFKTYLVCLHELKLAHPTLRDLPWGPPAMNLEQLRAEVTACVASEDQDLAFFQALSTF